MKNDYYKKLGRLEEVETFQQAQFYVQEYWPNAEWQATDGDVINFIVKTDAGAMLVGYAWPEGDGTKSGAPQQ